MSFTGPFPPTPPFELPEKYIKGIKKKKIMSDDDVLRKGMVASVDDAVGEIVKLLKSTEQWNNTIIIFLSDNGSYLPDGNLPFYGVRGSLDEGGVRVPAFITSPLLSEQVRGSVVLHMVHITDIFPTILGLTGGRVKIRLFSSC